MTLIPKSRVVSEEIVVRLSKVKIFVESLVLALQQTLEGFERRLIVRWASNLHDVVSQKRLILGEMKNRNSAQSFADIGLRDNSCRALHLKCRPERCCRSSTWIL